MFYESKLHNTRHAYLFAQLPSIPNSPNNSKNKSLIVVHQNLYPIYSTKVSNIIEI
jgi:hypothetical protein